jgi:hypothetical protein
MILLIAFLYLIICQGKISWQKATVPFLSLIHLSIITLISLSLTAMVKTPTRGEGMAAGLVIGSWQWVGRT